MPEPLLEAHRAQWATPADTSARFHSGFRERPFRVAAAVGVATMIGLGLAWAVGIRQPTKVSAPNPP
ncbi:MAG: hypothetical protein ACRDRT_10755 [Pseudonocardiaceae bacterium]